MDESSEKADNKPDLTGLSFWQKLGLFFWKMLPFVILIIILLFGIAQLFFMIQEKQAALKEKRINDALNQKEIKVDVITAKLQPRELIDNIVLPGVVRPWEELVIQSQVSGKITKILKDEGDYVKKGEIIALIDDRDYKASLNIAKTRLDRITKDFERTKRLHGKNVVSLSNYEEDEAAWLEAKSTYELDKLRYEKCIIKAPFSGHINKRFIKLGSLVSSESDIVEILDTSKVRVYVNIPEADIDQVRDLDVAQIKIVSLDYLVFEGKKVFLSIKPDRDTHTFLLQLEVKNDKGILRPGMFVEADIVREHKKGAIQVPLFSVIARGNEKFCYVVQNGIATKKPVKLGIIKQKAVEIIEGLDSGDELIIKGQRQLEDNQPVNVIQSVELNENADLAVLNGDGMKLQPSKQNNKGI